MSLVKWSPIRRTPTFSIFDDMDRLVNSMIKWRGEVSGPEGSWFPALDIHETEKNYEVNLDLPGMEKKDIEIAISDGVLNITGERKAEMKDEKKSCIRSEISYGKFTRSFRLSDDVDEENIKASFSNGVLTIAIAKREPVKPEVKQIAIK